MVTYNKTYTLATPMEGIHSILNGRIFGIKKDKDGHLSFYDRLTNEKLLDSTRFVERIDLPNGRVRIKTKSGTVYNLIHLTAILPTVLDEPKNVDATTAADTDKITASVKIPTVPAPVGLPKTEAPKSAVKIDFKVVDEETSHKGINYSDGYTQTVFTFNREITEAEFLAFCESKNMRMKPKGAWYEDYCEISGSGKTWTHRWVNVYTD